MSDTSLTRVMIRDPRPPHGAVLEVLGASLKYSFKVRRTGTAAFGLSRKDSNVTNYLSSILTNEPAMVTFERPDGYMPWVGFVTQYDESEVDDSVLVQCADHSWRLTAPHGARTQRNQAYKTASGRIIKDVFRLMEDRGEPAPLLKYDSVPDGPSANYEVRMDYGLDLLEAMAKQTNYEWGFAYAVTQQSVEARLLWQGRLGTDRRNEEVWSEQRHFTNWRRTVQYANGIKATIAIGGSGDFGTRPAVTVNKSGSAGQDGTLGVSAYPKTPVSAYGLGGTRMEFSEQVTDAIALRTIAAQMHEAPEYAVEQIGFSLLTSNVDMSRFALGDIHTIRLQSALGGAIERVVRVIGFEADAYGGTMNIETQVL